MAAQIGREGRDAAVSCMGRLSAKPRDVALSPRKLSGRMPTQNRLASDYDERTTAKNRATSTPTTRWGTTERFAGVDSSDSVDQRPTARDN